MICSGTEAVMVVMGVAANTDETSLARPPLICCVAQFLTDHGVMSIYSPGVGDPCNKRQKGTGML